MNHDQGDQDMEDEAHMMKTSWFRPLRYDPNVTRPSPNI